MRSVGRRGFHDQAPPVFADPVLGAQIAWLAAEAAEYEEAWRAADDDLGLTELADMAIVLAQIAWLVGRDPDGLSQARYLKLGGTTIMIVVGHVGHEATRMRAGRNTDLMWRALLQAMAYIYTRAAQKHNTGADALDGIIRQKLAADESRGALHGRGGDNEPAQAWEQAQAAR